MGMNLLMIFPFVYAALSIATVFAKMCVFALCRNGWMQRAIISICMHYGDGYEPVIIMP